MSIDTIDEDMLLGSVHGHAIRLPHTALQISALHARRIAAELGTPDAESSLAAYWSIATRVRQWQQIRDRVGSEQAQQAQFVEIGSGMGLFVLVGRLLGFRVVGVESSSERYLASLQIARTLCAANNLSVPIAQAHAERLPFADASIDLVASFQTLEHVGDLEQTLREARRILKPGGVFFAQAPNYHSFYEAHYGVLAPLPLGKSWTRRYIRLLGRPQGFLGHLQWLSPARLRELLLTCGFTTVQVGAPSAPSYHSGEIPVVAPPLPFHFRRGAVAERLANLFARLCHRLQLGPDYYPQLEIWATA